VNCRKYYKTILIIKIIKMSEKWFDVAKIINELPKDVGKNTNIYIKLDELKKESDFDKKKLIIEEIQQDIDSFVDTLSDASEREKLEDIKKQLDKFKTSLDKLQRQIKKNPKIPKEKIFEVSEQMEKEWLFWKDDSGIEGFFRKILKWLESLFSPSSSDDKIAKTFEKLWYWNNEKVIKKILKVIDKIPLDKLDEKIKDLNNTALEPKNNDKSSWEKFLNLPVIKDLLDFVDEYFWTNEKIDTLEEKKIAIRILKTVSLNKDLVKSGDSWITWFIKKKIEDGIIGSIIWKNNVGNTKKTVWTVLDKMFDHGFSDSLRDYALPEDGVKLIDYKNKYIDIKE